MLHLLSQSTQTCEAQLIQFASSFYNKFMVSQLNMYKLDINLLKGVITKKSNLL